MDSIHSLNPYWLVIGIFIFSIIPIIVGTCSSYLKISIVFGMLRNGLGTQHIPSNLIIVLLSLSLSLIVMQKEFYESSQLVEGLVVNEKLTDFTFLDFKNNLKAISAPWKRFMVAHTGEHELKVLKSIHHDESKESIGMIVSAFILSELKEAFAMGFVLLIPFLIIDLIIVNVLTGLGIQTLTPSIVSLPLKLFFFVMADGWLLVSKNLISSF